MAKKHNTVDRAGACASRFWKGPAVGRTAEEAMKPNMDLVEAMTTRDIKVVDLIDALATGDVPAKIESLLEWYREPAPVHQ